MPARYSIGIDLGTSNSALAWVSLDQNSRKPSAALLQIPQLVGVDKVRSLLLLPSYLYLRPKEDPGDAAERSRIIVGEFARLQLAQTPGRVVQSAKSWLSHPRADRRAAILPWRSHELGEGERMSPVGVSAAFLRYLRECWEESPLGGETAPFAEQEITITVPASFDEVAQELTLEAAKSAGFPEHTRLLEEPQSAFYRVLARNPLLSLHSESATLLVVDIGGGTTDFSLLRREPSGEWHRIAVSDHLLLGGDNIDLALARELERRSGARADPSDFARLIVHARELKERFLSEKGSEPADQSAAPRVYRFSLSLGAGDLFATSRSVEITATELSDLLVEGFFPRCRADDLPTQSTLSLREEGLPFAKDPRVTVHLAAFLAGRKVDGILLTGGTLKGALFADRIVDVVSSFAEGQRPRLIANDEMEYAVALGAADYGRARRTAGGRIRSGYPHALFLEVLRSKRPVYICLVPRGAEEGFEILLQDHPCVALANTPVRFQLFVARSDEKSFKAGEIFNSQELGVTIDPLPPLQTTLKFGADRAEVILSVRLEATGALALRCNEREGARSWQLRFALKSDVTEDNPINKVAGASEKKATLQRSSNPASSRQVEQAQTFLTQFFGPPKRSEVEVAPPTPKRVFQELERMLGSEKNYWDVLTLRALWSSVATGVSRRRRSADHERTFCMLAGFLLRPGFGEELDNFRIAELWKCFDAGLAFPKSSANVEQWWIMWRRVAGGLDSTQQESLFHSISSVMMRNAEALRLFGALESLSAAIKEEAGTRLVTALSRRDRSLPAEVQIWTLARLISRVPVYADGSHVLPAPTVAQWFAKLAALDWSPKGYPSLAAAFAGGVRITEDRSIDVDETLRLEVRAKLVRSGALRDTLRIVDEYVPVSYEDQVAQSGETLPLGLRLLG